MQSAPEAEEIAQSSSLPASDVFTSDALPPGSKLDEFEIVRVLGVGGFGIVYLALDQVLLRYVAIKEFIPTALARRTPEGAVTVRSADDAETFAIGLDSFYNEGRLLARFDHPSLVRVFRFWKANGTAYMAMQYYPGQTLKEARRQMAAPPDEAWLRLFVDRLLGALETLHAEGVYHRDIAPDNILLLPDGHPVILDFGSARRVISGRTQSLTAILKPNYSPVEQYADDAGMRQGSYTDLYALGGTVYFMLCGKEPIPAVMRAVRDSFPVLALTPAEPFQHVSSEFLAAFDWCLGVSPDDRPQTVADLRSVLRGDKPAPAPRERHGVLISDPTQAYDAARAMARTEVAARSPVVVTEAVAAALAEAAVDAFAHVSVAAGPAAAAAWPTERPRGRRTTWLVMSGLGVAAVGVLLWAVLGTPQASSAQSAATSPAPPQAPLQAPSGSPSGLPAQAAVAAPPSIASAVAAAPLRPESLVGESSTEPRSPQRRASGPEAPARAGERRSTRATPVPAANSPGRAPTRPSVLAAAEAPAAPRPALSKAPDAPVASAEGTAVPCADMNIFARALCLNRACETPRWTLHPHCIEARRIAEQRQQRLDQ